MKFALFKQKIQAYSLHSGFLVFVMYFFLASAGWVQAADTQIAFESTRSRHGIVEIYLMDPDGEQIRQITDEPKYDGEPAWSPDGKRITFVSYRDLKELPEHRVIRGDIYVMNADGSNPINLTQSPERPAGVSSWSPDRKQIAFTSGELFNDDILTNSDIWVMDTDGANPRNRTNHEAQDQTPDWSPDGLRIAFTSDRDRNWEIYLMNADGTNLINLTNHPARDGRPDWSPDGQQIAFTSDREGDGNTEVYVMNADGTNPINLTNHPARDDRPDWSPDGQQIAFSTTRDRKDDEDKNVEIYVMNANGTNPINLTNHPAWDSSPSWGSVRPLGVSSKKKLATLWGKVKRSNTYGIR